jgi:TRAP-type C4-dicarboxylate transport system substrate-binding protein
MNLDKWKSLSQKQKDLLMKHVIALENGATMWRKVNEDDTKRQAQAGIQTITFDAATAKQFYDRAYDIAWTNLIKASPTYGPQMKRLFSK